MSILSTHFESVICTDLTVAPVVARLGSGCVAMTQSGRMAPWLRVRAAFCWRLRLAVAGCRGASSDEPAGGLHRASPPVPPARPPAPAEARARALQLRWQQFESLMAGNAPMPEPGFARALYYQVAGNAEAGQAAVAWALGSGGTDLRQLALVFDWCQDLLSETQQHALAARLQKRHGGHRRRSRASRPCGPACWPPWRCSTMRRRRPNESWSAPCGSGGTAKLSRP